MILRRKGDKAKYEFKDKRCLGRPCFVAGMYQHRGATMSGSRNTGSPDSPCCLTRAYRGCPAGPEGERTETWETPDGPREVTIQGVPEYDPELAKKRKEEGWRS